MDSCTKNLNKEVVKHGSNDTTNCQLIINKETFNRNENPLTRKELYSALAKRLPINTTNCIADDDEDDEDDVIQIIIDTTNQNKQPTPNIITTTVFGSIINNLDEITIDNLNEQSSGLVDDEEVKDEVKLPETYSHCCPYF